MKQHPSSDFEILVRSFVDTMKHLSKKRIRSAWKVGMNHRTERKTLYHRQFSPDQFYLHTFAMQFYRVHHVLRWHILKVNFVARWFLVILYHLQFTLARRVGYQKGFRISILSWCHGSPRRIRSMTSLHIALGIIPSSDNVFPHMNGKKRVVPTCPETSLITSIGHTRMTHEVPSR
jgi:hypothetical protein